MRKLVGVLFILGLFCYFVFTKKGAVTRNVALSYVVETNHIEENGGTISERILLPENFRRAYYKEHTFERYLQEYALKPFEAEIINYDGEPYIYQQGHVGILEIPVPKNGLQQCADALIRIRAEYLWDQNRKDEIGFNFTSGHFCSWKKYAEGYRPKVDGNKVTFSKTATVNTSKENFYNYLNLVYLYAGTFSLHHELDKIDSSNELEVGDMIVKPGFPGHILMIVDKATNGDGKNLFIFAQGNTPAQSVHVLKNLNDTAMSPWYDLEAATTLEIPTYYFDEIKFIRFKE